MPGDISNATDQPTQYGKDQDGAAPQPAGDDDDPVPENIDEFRNRMAQRIYRFIGNTKGYWRTCKEPVCRRHRACAAPHIHCSNARPLPSGTPDQQTRAMARVQRMLRDGMARQGEGE